MISLLYYVISGSLTKNLLVMSQKQNLMIQVESLFRIEFTACPFVIILNEVNAIIRQMSSDINARESENAMCDILISARYVLAIDAFANKSILAFFKAYCGEDIHIIDNRYQSRVDEMVKILYDLNSEAKAIRIGYDLLRQGKRVAFVSTGAVMVRALVEKASKLSKSDNSPVRACAYYGDIDGKQRQKDFSNINNIWGKLDCVAYTNIVEVAKLESAQPNNLPTVIKGHCEWNNNIISYKVDSSPAVITFIEVEHQKHFSARYFIEKLYSLIANESRGVIGNYKRVHNEIRVEALVIKNTDFNAIATFWNLSPEKAEVLKFDQERSIADIITLKRFYMQILYCKDMQSYDKKGAMKGLKAEENIQWEIACYRAEENLKNQ
ncbi:8329_t:CDS:2 [Funneliformis geosporum]|uniref:8329_t:CDS:1 n=1 Tax=Funneliformis geosporum TaxID=1117311 RepID=A0A9W4T225_9GLOM|nr:8329_t:CDS:2 [Funneliformis geosporum]